ncbi:MAG: hypothetical protein AAFU64_08390, partial [Bacteroidota bacterium]
MNYLLKKKFLLLISFSLLVCHPILAQEPKVCRGDITLSSQGAVDAFDCEILEGSLFIGVPFGNSANIDNLNVLESIEEIKGNLTISNADLIRNLKGLKNLKSLGGDLIIEYCDEIRNLEGLLGLET